MKCSLSLITNPAGFWKSKTPPRNEHLPAGLKQQRTPHTPGHTTSRSKAKCGMCMCVHTHTARCRGYPLWQPIERQSRTSLAMKVRTRRIPLPKPPKHLIVPEKSSSSVHWAFCWKTLEKAMLLQSPGPAFAWDSHLFVYFGTASISQTIL